MHFSLVFHLKLGRPGLYIVHYFLRSLLNYMFYTNHSDKVDIRCKQWERISRRLWIFYDINSSVKGTETLVWHASQGVFLSNLSYIHKNYKKDTKAEILWCLSWDLISLRYKIMVECIFRFLGLNHICY